MKARSAILLVVGLVVGFLVRHYLPFPASTASHWQAVHEYNAYIRDPANRELDPTTGLYFNEPPIDPLPHLAALVAAGELYHLDIALPTVPRSKEATAYWLAFCEEHRDEIIYATGAATYGIFKPKGGHPLHLNIWYKDSGGYGVYIVQQLLKDLEEMGPGDD